MKIGEKFIDGEGTTFHVQNTYDIEPVLERAAQLRSAEKEKFGESRLVGTVPGWLVHQWMKEAGVAHNDEHARNELLRKKLMSGEFSKLRVWQGTW